MVNLWYKYNQKEDSRKRHTLHSLGVGFVFFIILFLLTKFFEIPLCLFKHVFGFSCFGCGMTRGFVAILYLDFKSAYEYNILSIPLFLGILIYSCCAIIDIVFRKNYILNIETIFSKKYMYIVYLLILIISTFLNNII